MSQENVEVVRRSQEAWKEGYIDGFLANVPPDAEWVIAEENPKHERFVDGTRSPLTFVTGSAPCQGFATTRPSTST